MKKKKLARNAKARRRERKEPWPASLDTYSEDNLNAIQLAINQVVPNFVARFYFRNWGNTMGTEPDLAEFQTNLIAMKVWLNRYRSQRRHFTKLYIANLLTR